MSVFGYLKSKHLLKLTAVKEFPNNPYEFLLKVFVLSSYYKFIYFDNFL